MKKRIFSYVVLLFVLAFLPGSALAQTYSFSLDRETVNVYWNEDGTTSIDYVLVFTNDDFASPIDFVDVGIPNSNFDPNSIYADVNGQEINNISASDFQGEGGSGVAVGLGSYAIQPGRTGQVHVLIGTVHRMLRPDSQDKNYASGVFGNMWFGSQYVHGTTDMTVTFHFPPGVKPEEPRWHESPSGWSSEPTSTGIDDQGRVYYTWANAQANGYTQYTFGVSFPTQYVPASAIVKPSIFEMLGISSNDLIGLCLCLGFIGIFSGSIFAAVRGTQKRKLQYLPPKIAIEGQGIKRGLTAIEAAILMEQPLDKILTMILFAVIKKGAASVVTRDPLKLDVTSPLPEGLNPYETQFLQAFNLTDAAARRSALQDMMIDLVKTVSTKMKGFSRKETLAYYRDIVQRAWGQVEAADTPEVKGQKFDEVMEWTMLDRDYDERTRRVFTGPVFVPIWWGHYDPTYRPGPVSASGSGSPVSTSAGGGGGISLPHLPGSDFAASMVNSVQTFSGNVIGSLTDFTSKVTNKTNPVPVATSSGRSFRSGGGGGGCACACACAGCACACAGGGR
jgi:hypothetical protein